MGLGGTVCHAISTVRVKLMSDLAMQSRSIVNDAITMLKNLRSVAAALENFGRCRTERAIGDIGIYHTNTFDALFNFDSCLETVMLDVQWLQRQFGKSYENDLQTLRCGIQIHQCIHSFIVCALGFRPKLVCI